MTGEIKYVLLYYHISPSGDEINSIEIYDNFDDAINKFYEEVKDMLKENLMEETIENLEERGYTPYEIIEKLSSGETIDKVGFYDIGFSSIDFIEIVKDDIEEEIGKPIKSLVLEYVFSNIEYEYINGKREPYGYASILYRVEI